MIEAIQFQNRNGKMLHGVAHLPSSSCARMEKIGICILNPGIKSRVAPHRLNVKLARELSHRGYHVFRFDPEGIGDSEGELPEGVPIADIWGLIQQGAFVIDTVAANEYFRKRFGLQRLIVAGSCGGAITALLAAKEDSTIDGLCLIDIPIYLWSSTMSLIDISVTGGKKADDLWDGYIRKVFRLGSWYRFLSFQTDYRALFQTIRKKLALSSRQGFGSEVFDQIVREKKLNKKFFESFESFVEKRKPVLFVLAENDFGTEAFQTYFQRGYFVENYATRSFKTLVDYHVVEQANHIYTLIEWQQELLGRTIAWIEQNFGLRSEVKE